MWWHANVREGPTTVPPQQPTSLHGTTALLAQARVEAGRSGGKVEGTRQGHIKCTLSRNGKG